MILVFQIRGLMRCLMRVKHMSHQTITDRQEKLADSNRLKNGLISSPIFLKKLSVSFVGRNSLIWLSHSPTIKDYKNLVFRALNT